MEYQTSNYNKKSESNEFSFPSGQTHEKGQANDGARGKIILPLPPKGDGDIRFEMEIYARFMRHLRQVPSSLMETKVLSSVQFTADVMEVSGALVAKTLVDMGMKAPRRAFPVAFLDFADKCMSRSYWEQGAAQPSVVKLHDHWQRIGESRFAGAERTDYALYNETVFAGA